MCYLILEPMISTFRIIEMRMRHATQQEGEDAAVLFHVSKNPQAKPLPLLSRRFLDGTLPPREKQHLFPLLCGHLPLVCIIFIYCPSPMEIQEKHSGVWVFSFPALNPECGSELRPLPAGCGSRWIQLYFCLQIQLYFSPPHFHLSGDSMPY